MYTENPNFYIALFVHLISLVLGFGSVLIIDIFGLLWLLKLWGVTLDLLRRIATVTQRLIWVGFIGLVISGIPLLMMKGSVSDLTKIKLFLVVLVGLNGFYMHYIKQRLDALGSENNKVPSEIIFRIGLASFISQLGWWGATAIGFYNRQVGEHLGWPEYYIPVMGLIVFVIGVSWTVVEILAARKQV